MANPEHVEVVKQGTKAIAEWRKKNPDVRFDLREADLREADLREADLREAKLGGADLSKADLSKADLSSANLSGANLIEADLREAKLGAADLSRAKLGGADLSRAKLGGAKLSGATLGWANLREADLREADLGGAKLGGADLGGADLRWANLREANLSRANLSGANLSRANLSGANLIEANLGWANLSWAKLSDTKFTRATIGLTSFGDVDLSDAKELETVKHEAPSTVGVDTLYRSKGKIPVEFLRGCGIPDELIAYLPSLLGAQQAVQFYSCFISYSHKDEEFAKRLYSRMRDEKLRVWYAPEDMKSGRKIHEQIDEAIRVHDKLLLVLSDHSMASEWVATEIYHARQREVTEGKRVLFPIRLVPFDDIREWKCFDARYGQGHGPGDPRVLRPRFLELERPRRIRDGIQAAAG